MSIIEASGLRAACATESSPKTDPHPGAPREPAPGVVRTSPPEDHMPGNARRAAHTPRLEPLEPRTLLSAGVGGGAWADYARDPQHTALSAVPAAPLEAIRWAAPGDRAPQFRGDALLVHYGAPLVTAADTVIVPVKTGAADGFEIQGRDGTDG